MARVERLEELVEALPHGSGFDDDWHIEVRHDGAVLTTEYHEMSEYGFYIG